MSDWPIKSITEIVEFNPTRKIKKGSIAPFIDMAALPTGSREISEVGHREFQGSGSKFQNGDTLFARITPCLENGKTAKVTVLKDDEVGHGSTEFIVLSAKHRQYDEDFIYYIARLPEFRIFAQSRMEGTSGRQRVPWQALATFELKIPPKEIRKNIGDFLCILDNKIELNRQINQTLEQIAQAIFKSWFVDFDPVKAKIYAKQTLAPDLSQSERELIVERAAMRTISGLTDDQLDQLSDDQRQQLAATAALFPDELVDSELGEIPKGWEIKSLDQIADYLNGLALQKFPSKIGEESIPVIKIAQLKSGNTEGSERVSTSIKDEYKIKNGDVLFSWSGSLYVDIWCGGLGALNQHLFKVTSSTYPKWLYLFWTNYHLEEFQRIAADKAVTMGHIKRSHLSSAKCVIPCLKSLAILGNHFERLIDLVIERRLENVTLTSIRDTLLPKLLSGDISLSSNEQS